MLSSGAPVDELVAMKLNALLVDLSVLGPEGWSFLDRVCGMLPGLGVVVCTPNSTVAQRVRGLRLGADDWIAKPCHPEEVMARIEAVVRRRRRSQPQQETGPAGGRRARDPRATSSRPSSAASSVGLTRREFELLQLLAEAQGTVIEREEIYQRVWGYAMAHGDRSVDVFVRKLRRKLEKRVGRLAVHPHPFRRRLPLRARGRVRWADRASPVRARPVEPRPTTMRGDRHASRRGSTASCHAVRRVGSSRVHSLFTSCGSTGS